MNPSDASYFRYVPVSPLDRDWGLFVTTAGHARTPPGRPYPPSRHPHGYHFSWKSGRVLHEYQLVYVTRGAGSFESEATGRRTLRAGSAVMLFPGVWHRYAPRPSTGWEEYWVGFEGDYARRLVQRGFFSPATAVIDVGLDPATVELFVSLIELMRQESLGYQQRMAAGAVQLLAGLYAAAQGRGIGGDQHEAAVRQAKCLMLEEMDRAIDLEQLARDLGVGYAWFRRLFKRYTGLAPHQYHLQLRMNKARQLLAGTGATVKEVAAQLGFDDPHYFCRIFRKKTGHTPEAWRSVARGQGR